MKKDLKNYNLKLLLSGIALLLLQLSSLTLQNHYGHIGISAGAGFDTFIFIVLAVAFIVQPLKRMATPISIIILFYSLVNLIYSLSFDVIYLVTSVDPEYTIFLVLLMVLSYTTLLIASLFLLIHSIQPRFAVSITKKVIGGILAISLLFLLLAGILVIPSKVTLIITLVVFILSFAALYVSTIFLVSEPIVEEVTTPSGIDQLERLYSRGLITKEEYEKRKEEITKK